MGNRSDLLAYLEGTGSLDDAAIDLAETALVLAALDYPESDLESYRSYLAELVQDVGAEAPGVGNLADRSRALRSVLVEAHEFQGDMDTYNDMQNANLIRVIDRRMGLPVALGILYIHSARSQGWGIDGLNVPAHFLLRLRTGEEESMIDPFNGGKPVGPDALNAILGLPAGAGPPPSGFPAMANREILLRLQNNIKVRAVQEKNVERAVEVLRTMIAIAPGSAGLWWETANLQAEAGSPMAAIKTLEECIAHPATTDPPDALDEMLTRLRRTLN